MRAPLWTVVRTSEWEASVSDVDPGDGYFERNLETVFDALSLGPYENSKPFVTDRDDVRLFLTRDDAAGYRVIVLFRVDGHRRRVELGWVALETLEDEA